MKKQLKHFNFQAAAFSLGSVLKLRYGYRRLHSSPGLFPSLTASSSQATATEGRMLLLKVSSESLLFAVGRTGKPTAQLQHGT